MKIEEAVNFCKQTNYEGWQMVTFVQKYLNKQMKYSLDNPQDLPKVAFEKGYGYCWQQAWCLSYILKKVNIRSELVYATKVDFYESPLKKNITHQGGHVWCRVFLNGKEKYVCSCHKDNTPDNLFFIPVSEIKKYHLLAMGVGYLGTIFYHNT